MLFKFVTLLCLTAVPPAAGAHVQDDVAHLGQAQDAQASNEQQVEFRVKCEFLSADGDKTLSAPVVTVFAGQPAVIKDQSQTPFVTDVILNNGAAQPVVEVMSEGFDIRLRASETTDGKILLRINAVRADITDVIEAQCKDAVRSPATGQLCTVQIPTHKVQTLRGGRALENGGSTEFSFEDGSRVKFTVQRVK